MKLCNRNFFTTEEATRYHTARRQAQQALWKLNLLMLMKGIALQDPVLRDIRAKKRQLCWPEDTREEETLEHKEVARINKINEDVELAFAEARGEPFIVVRTSFVRL